MRSATKIFPSALERALASISSELRSVKARQKISATAFELGHELFRKLQLDLGIAAKLPERTEQSGKTKRWSVFHDAGLGSISKLFRFRVGVLDLAKAVDQLAIERVFSGKNSPVGDSVPQHVGRKIALL